MARSTVRSEGSRPVWAVTGQATEEEADAFGVSFAIVDGEGVADASAVGTTDEVGLELGAPDGVVDPQAAAVMAAHVHSTSVVRCGIRVTWASAGWEGFGRMTQRGPPRVTRALCRAGPPAIER